MSFADDMRQKADEKHQAAIELIQSRDLIKQDDDGNLDAANLMMAIVGLTSATTLQAIADQTDYLVGVKRLSRIDELKATIADRNSAIRTASASGNWDEFNRLVELGGAPEVEPEPEREPET